MTAATGSPRGPDGAPVAGGGVFEEVPACPFCGLTESDTLFPAADRMHGLPGAFSLVRCRRCGLVRLTPRPTRQSIAAYYPEDYGPHAQRQRPRWIRPLIARWGGVAHRCRIVGRLGPPGRILDVGCATGDFLGGMQERGWEVHGVELSPQAAARAREKLRSPVFVGDLLEAGLPSAHFDVVTLWNVLEHLFDPLDTLREAHRILKPGGWLVVCVPNTGDWAARMFGPRWAGWDAPRHLILFPPPLMEEALGRAGFTVKDRACTYGSCSCWMLSLRFLVDERWGRRVGRLADRPLRDNLLLRALLAPWFFFVNAMGRGTLVTFRARRDGDAPAR